MLLFDSTLRVPLIVAAPGMTPAVRSDPISLIDIAPTLLALAGVASDSTSTGRSVLQAAEPDREVYAETDYPEAAGWQAGRALIQARFKLISSGRSQLFDVSTDGARNTTCRITGADTTAMATRLETLAKPAADAPSASRVMDAETALRFARWAMCQQAGGRPPKRQARIPPITPSRGRRSNEHCQPAFVVSPAGAASVRGPRASLPERPIFETTYAQSLAEIGRTAEALKVLRALVGRRANDAALYHELAVVARSAGRSDEAQRAERAALTIEPGFAAAQNGLGLLLADAGDHAGARQAFEEATRLDSSNASYLANLGNARRALGDLEAARQAYQTALERDDSLTDPANGLGVILVQQRRASEAVPWFERAISRDPTFVEAQLNLGIALHESGQRDRAVSQYQVVERCRRPALVTGQRLAPFDSSWRDGNDCCQFGGQWPVIASGQWPVIAVSGRSAGRRLARRNSCDSRAKAGDRLGDRCSGHRLVRVRRRCQFVVTRSGTCAASRPHHRRHSPSGSSGRLRLRAGADAGHRPAGTRRRSVSQAFTTAPITLPAHASLLTGRYPPGHGARHNGLAMSTSVPTLATILQQAGFSTAAFVSAFPLDKRFGLARGFDIYDDQLPRGPDRKPLNERAGDESVRRAVEWLSSRATQRTFLWLHLFEPHAPYGDAASGRSVAARYDDEVAASDRAIAQLLEALGARIDSTLVVVAADHGEAFGEHGEIGHSIFVYDTTLRIPLVMKGPGLPIGHEVTTPVTLVDVAPTVLPLLTSPASMRTVCHWCRRSRRPVRLRIARFTRSRSPPCSISAGAHSAACAMRRGNTLPRRGLS